METSAGGPVRQFRPNPQQCGSEDPEQNRAADLSRHQDQRQHQTEAGDLDFAIRKIAEADKSRGIRHHDFSVAQAHERDEQTNSHHRGMFQRIRNSVDDLLANAADGEDQEKHAGKKYRAQRRGPRHMHAEAYRIGEISVE